jgi:hypothetical protein
VTEQQPETVDNPGVADEDSDATQQDELVEQTENAPTEQDGPQDDVDQDPTDEADVDDAALDGEE